MINRVLIRSKVLQLVYSYCLNNNKSLENLEKELDYSLAKAYDLYNYLLLLMPAVTRYARKKIELGKRKLKPTPEEIEPNTKFINNRFIEQLENNLQLQDFVKNQKKSWENSPEIIKSLFELISSSDVYKEYMASEDNSYEADRELWRKIYKTIICNNNNLNSYLEEQSLYWNDDKDIVDTFVLKTIKRFTKETLPAEKVILSQFKDEDDRKYAMSLLGRSIVNMDYYRELIANNVKNWNIERVAFMDVVIMQIALAEILSFPSIPVSVSLNEYVDLAKIYSTPKSGSFVNGTLEGIVNQLKNDGILTKI